MFYLHFAVSGIITGLTIGFVNKGWYPLVIGFFMMFLLAQVMFIYLAIKERSNHVRDQERSCSCHLPHGTQVRD